MPRIQRKFDFARIHGDCGPWLCQPAPLFIVPRKNRTLSAAAQVDNKYETFTFWFASAENRDKFKASPWQFVPRYGGFGAYRCILAWPHFSLPFQYCEHMPHQRQDCERKLHVFARLERARPRATEWCDPQCPIPSPAPIKTTPSPLCRSS